MLALQLVIIEIHFACCPPLANVSDTGYNARHCTHTQPRWPWTAPWLYISVFWLSSACRINPISVWVLLPLFQPPTQLWTAVRTWWPSASNYRAVHQLFPWLPSVVLRLYSPIFTYMWAQGFTCQNNLPSLYSVSSSDCTFPRLLLFAEHVSWLPCDHLWYSNRAQSLWWPETTGEIMITYRARSRGDGKKVHILF